MTDQLSTFILSTDDSPRLPGWLLSVVEPFGSMVISEEQYGCDEQSSEIHTQVATM